MSEVFKKKKEEKCENSDKNPLCPYLTKIVKLETDIKWLKKGYWVQTGFTILTFIAVIVAILRGI